MAATTPKSKKHVRRSAKKYRMTTFESTIFEGEFTLPDIKQAPMKIMNALNTGNMAVLHEWLKATGVSEEDMEAFFELDGEEFKTFTEEWSDSFLGKSSR